MGQYFQAVLENKSGRTVSFNPHRYDNGMKLMEHSYIGNNYTGTVYETIRNFGPLRCAWVGDYSDSESLDKDGKWFLAKVFGDERKRKRVLRYFKKVWTKSVDGLIYDFQEEALLHKRPDYLVNLDRKEYIRVPALTDELCVHPLPILTCSCPGSGGNFRPHNDWEEEVFCSWCGDLVDVCDKKPTGEDWKEIEYLFEKRD